MFASISEHLTLIRIKNDNFELRASTNAHFSERERASIERFEVRHNTNYFFQTFIACGCSSFGASSTSCTSSGVCSCKSNFVGDKCTSCKDGFYDYPNCNGKIHTVGRKKFLKKEPFFPSLWGYLGALTIYIEFFL